MLYFTQFKCVFLDKAPAGKPIEYIAHAGDIKVPFQYYSNGRIFFKQTTIFLFLLKKQMIIFLFLLKKQTIISTFLLKKQTIIFLFLLKKQTIYFRLKKGRGYFSFFFLFWSNMAK